MIHRHHFKHSPKVLKRHWLTAAARWHACKPGQHHACWTVLHRCRQHTPTCHTEAFSCCLGPRVGVAVGRTRLDEGFLSSQAVRTSKAWRAVLPIRPWAAVALVWPCGTNAAGAAVRTGVTFALVTPRAPGAGGAVGALSWWAGAVVPAGGTLNADLAGVTLLTLVPTATL